jgi:hypothetical protein
MEKQSCDLSASPIADMAKEAADRIVGPEPRDGTNEQRRAWFNAWDRVYMKHLLGL